MNRLKIFGMAIVLLMFVGGTGLGLTDIDLESPQVTGNAFPEGEAGIAAYINTGQTIDIEDIKTIFYRVEEVGDNYIIGKTSIPDYGASMGVSVYADIDGWIVAYLKSDEPAAAIMQWGSTDQVNNPNIGVIKSTTLEDALYKAGDAAGVGIVAGDIKYYDFEFPNANRMMIIAKTQASHGSSIHQIEIPEDYMLFEASYYHYVRYYSRQRYSYEPKTYWNSKLKVDTAIVSDASTSYQGDEVSKWWTAFGQYRDAIVPGNLHTITISYRVTHSGGSGSVDKGSAGVATVLIYRTA